MVETGLNRFDRWEKKAFDRAYPPEEIDAFINGQGDDPVEIFSALAAFDFPEVRPDARNLVLAHFSDSRFAPQILMHDGQNGETMVYRRNIVPLLRASQDVFWKITDLFNDDFKSTLNYVLSRSTSNAERDWQR
jgi:hypothetical protein